MKEERDLNYLKKIVTDLPEDYLLVRQQIIDRYSSYIIEGKDIATIDENMGLHFSKIMMSWLRKHVYFLIHDLYKSNELDENFQIILEEIDSTVTGFISTDYIEPFKGEEEFVHYDLVKYVRSMKWLYDVA